MTEKPSPAAKRREKVLKLVRALNEKLRGKTEPLEYDDQGWRIVFGAYLHHRFLQRYKEGRELLDMAVADLDKWGIYYWIPIDTPPRGVVTPALRMMALESEQI